MPGTGQNIEYTDGVYVSLNSKSKFSDFEKNYLEVREKEKRVLSIDEIRQLPFVDKNSPDFNLWQLRRKNIGRFLNYISKKNAALNILDIGCGNGFFTQLLSENKKNKVTGIDVNLHELKQAAMAFGSSDIQWYYLDIMNEPVPGNKFDIITFCCSLQYFNDPVRLLELSKKLLTETGEIHIIDSPFYSKKTLKTAKNNTLKYYKNMGSESMNSYYYHNSFEMLRSFNFQFKYKPSFFLSKILRVKDSPFPWIMIKK